MSRKARSPHPPTHVPIKVLRRRFEATHEHYLHLIEDQTLEAVDFRRQGAQRPYWLVSLASFERFLQARASTARPALPEQTIGH